jgi:two-component system phosphate regulon sensor histidine kinase PhoR
MKKPLLKKPPLSGIFWIYITSLVLAVALLICWVLYVVYAALQINHLISRNGSDTTGYHWIILIVGCVLFLVLITGLSLQLAQTVSNRRYNKKMREFFSNITHELKSPLAAIQLSSQTLRQDDLKQTERQRFLALIGQQTDRMKTLVENILEMNRLEDRSVTLNLSPLDLNTFFQSYIKSVTPRLDLEKCGFVSTIKTNAKVLSNVFALQRILDNLIDNAIKASGPERLIQCRVTDDHSKKKVTITIEDHGVGIPKKDCGRIFDRFYQVVSSEGRPLKKGTGLGLSIVKRLTEEMNGNVWVESEEGCGSQFTLIFPIL